VVEQVPAYWLTLSRNANDVPVRLADVMGEAAC
jgi:hypothetical protein